MNSLQQKRVGLFDFTPKVIILLVTELRVTFMMNIFYRASFPVLWEQF
jgi:hypothetical protein